MNLKCRDLINAEIVLLHSALFWPHSELCDPLWLSSSCGRDSKGSGRNWRAESFWEIGMKGCEGKVALRENDWTYSKDRIKPNGQESREGFWPVGTSAIQQTPTEVARPITSGR